MKTCKKCGVERDLSRFHVNRHGNLNGTCKNCEADAKRKKYKEDPERRINVAHQNRAWKYGLDKEKYEAMLERQGGVCAICGATEPGGHGAWHVDHDHSCCNVDTAKGLKTCGNCNRGLLCTRCNVGLGAFGDNIDTLMSASAYLLQRTNVLI